MVWGIEVQQRWNIDIPLDVWAIMFREAYERLKSIDKGWHNLWIRLRFDFQKEELLDEKLVRNCNVSRHITILCNLLSDGVELVDV